MMRRFISVIVCLVLILSLCACGNSDNSTKYTVDDLTAEDYIYIDTVCDYVDAWDISATDSGKTFYINKISFKKFYEIDEVTFYFSYPIAAYYGAAFIVKEDDLKFLEVSKMNNRDAEIRHESYLGSTSISGTTWDHYATEEQKREMIISAYLSFLNGC